MFKKFKLPRFSRGGRQRQRGQLVLLYALFIPLIFFFVGLTFDLSWYYLNVSRMQNAADAAAVAGVQTLTGENGSLSYCMGKSFVRGYNGKTVQESYQDTSLGDRAAKNYIGKNISKGNTDWNDNTIIDLWTRNELSFDSLLLSETNDAGTLYYHVMLEEDVPHMFLKGWFDGMNAKVSSVVMINQYMKGYDLFQQMKTLGAKKAYPSAEAVSNAFDKKTNLNIPEDRIISRNMHSGIIDYRQVEEFKLSDKGDLKESFDAQKTLTSLFVGVAKDFSAKESESIAEDTVKKFDNAIHRIINIDTVYPVRDYDFYYDYDVLEKIRKENPTYDDMTDSELASALAKDSSDPMFIRIESEAPNERLRQVIINVNVANTDEMTDRPIILFYEGDVFGNSFPVIVNLNADFRGVVFAPNSPVVINGNGHSFEGFIIAESYVQLMTEDELDKDYYKPIEDDKYKYEYIDDEGNTQEKYLIYVDGYGNVQYKDKTIDRPTKETYNISYSMFNTFELVKLDYTPINTNIFFTTAQANTNADK